MNKSEINIFFHCWVLPGGGLQVLEKLLEKYATNDSVVRTLFSDRQYITCHKNRIQVLSIFSPFLQRFLIKNGRYRYLLPLFPLLTYLLGRKIKSYYRGKKIDTVIISSFACAKNIPIPQSKRTLLYLHSPMQYIHTHYYLYKKKLGRISRSILGCIRIPLQRRDTKKRSYDIVQTNSYHTKNIAEKLYDMRVHHVYYPTIDSIFLQYPKKSKKKKYFLFFGRVANLIKHVDLLIYACQGLQQKLIVVGDGPDKKYCKTIADPSYIKFIDRADKVQIKELLSETKATLSIGHESAGLQTIESLLCGVPVIGRNIGATPELLTTECGVLIDNLDVQEIQLAIKKIEEKKRDSVLIRKSIEQSLEGHLL